MNMRRLMDIVVEARSDMSLADAIAIFERFGVGHVRALLKSHDAEALKIARRKIIMQHHSDTGNSSDPNAAGLINSAYDTLAKSLGGGRPELNNEKRQPKFAKDQWVVCKNEFNTEIGLGRIIHVISRHYGYVYEIRLTDSEDTPRLWPEERLRAATEADKVRSRGTPPNFSEDDWVVCSDGRVGQISDSTGWDFEEQKRWYEVRFPDGDTDIVDEDKLRRAKPTDIERAKPKPKANTRSSGMVVREVAHYRQGTSDKVYGVVTRNGLIFTFWGRFQGSLNIKQFRDFDSADMQFHTKVMDGYKIVSQDRMENWLTDALTARFVKFDQEN